MTPKRPRDPNQLAKSIIDIATGQKPDRDPTPEEQGKDRSLHHPDDERFESDGTPAAAHD